ncbi:hypothetical protein [Paenibacillus flagellatus]|uniref:hypothetical protein n=1 Tax=Paenibacillus flagellatus TaxID=2211139 RepID=UPI001FE2C261|nr:hypothetical protein [Paenibacillus flagellatus]
MFRFGFETILPESPEAIRLLGTGYLLVTEKSLELAGGLLLLSGRFVPLAAAALFPVTVNIVLFHAFVDRGLLPLVLGMLAAHLYVLWTKRSHYAGLFES